MLPLAILGEKAPKAKARWGQELVSTRAATRRLLLCLEMILLDQSFMAMSGGRTNLALKARPGPPDSPATLHLGTPPSPCTVRPWRLACPCQGRRAWLPSTVTVTLHT